MPVARALSLRDLANLYRVLLKQHLGREKLSRADTGILDRDLHIYINNNFESMFQSEGALALMTPYLESGDSSAECVYDDKYGSGVNIVWDSSDTKAAKEHATKLKGMIRDTEEDDDAPKITNSDWHRMVAFELRIRLAHDAKKAKSGQSKADKSPAKRQQSTSHAASARQDDPPASPAAVAEPAAAAEAQAAPADARIALAGPSQGKRKLDDAQMTDDAIAEYLLRNPAKAIAIAKVATDIGSSKATDAPSSVDVERLPPKKPAVKVSRERPPKPFPLLDNRKPGTRVSLDGGDDEAEDSRKERKQQSYRSVDSDNPFNQEFPRTRTGTLDGIPINIVQSCMLSCFVRNGPFQNEDKASDKEHSAMVSETSLFFLPCHDLYLTAMHRYAPLSTLRLEIRELQIWRRTRYPKTSKCIMSSA
jgi:hypothetical protein